MTTAVLALQGAFAEHEKMLATLGEPTVELRDFCDLKRPFERLVLCGGESTAQRRLLVSRGMLNPLRERIEAGMPTLATCAGAILLAEHIVDASAPEPAGAVRPAALGEPAAPGPSMNNSEFLPQGSGGEPPTSTTCGSSTNNSEFLPQVSGGEPPASAERPAALGEPPALATFPATAVRNSWGRQLASFHTTAEFAGIGEVPMTFIRAPHLTDLRNGATPLATVDGRIVAARCGNQLATAFHPELDADTRIHELFCEM